jgi:hypothetical protein
MASRQGRVRAEDLPPIRTAYGLFSAADEQIAAIQARPDEDIRDDSDDELDKSGVYQYLSNNHCFTEFTHFSGNALEAIWRPIDSIMSATRHRGPAPLSSSMDHLLYLNLDEKWKGLCQHCQDI